MIKSRGIIKNEWKNEVWDYTARISLGTDLLPRREQNIFHIARSSQSVQIVNGSHSVEINWEVVEQKWEQDSKAWIQIS